MITNAAGQSPWRLSAEANPSRLRPGETCRFTLLIASLAAGRPEVSYDEPAFPRGLTPARACTQSEEFVGSEYRCRLTWELTATGAGTLVIPAANVTVLPAQGSGLTLRSQPVSVTVRDEPPAEPPMDARQGWLLTGLSACVLLAAIAVLVLLRRAERQRPLPGQALASVDPKSPEGRLLAALRQAAARRNRAGQAAYLAAVAGAVREFAGRSVGRDLLTTAEVRDASAGQHWQASVTALLEATDAARFARGALDEAVLESLLAALEASLRGV
ncbi:MAG: hypothetical protein HZB16_00900 [Armatimonadetes bacterium]|nr:hypothetical protein [Armatimonadota bacterium]